MKKKPKQINTLNIWNTYFIRSTIHSALINQLAAVSIFTIYMQNNVGENILEALALQSPQLRDFGPQSRKTKLKTYTKILQGKYKIFSCQQMVLFM
jgi:hypothetical protein